MRIVQKTEKDELISQHSHHISIEDVGNDLVRLVFGHTAVVLENNTVQEFLYKLAAYCAEKEVEEYPEEMSPEMQESFMVWKCLSNQE